jgi:hypothetical protein
LIDAPELNPFSSGAFNPSGGDQPVLPIQLDDQVTRRIALND